MATNKFRAIIGGLHLCMGKMTTLFLQCIDPEMGEQYPYALPSFQ